jgi:serine/threonine protein phosphatase 1
MSFSNILYLLSSLADCGMSTISLIPPPDRLYVIGDIHGRADLLECMIEQLHSDLEKYPIGNCLTVTIGDYIDRGMKSRDVLDRLAGNPFPTAFIPLKGNHEDLFETFLRDPSIGGRWRRLGGLETLHSYGVDVGPLMRGKDYEAAAEALRSAVPQAHLDFLASLNTALIVGRYFLCHAGVCPGVPLLQQREEDLLGIRERFLNSNADFGKIVVHGHTPVEAPEILPNRINIDTGAFMTGRLTCVVLEEERVRFLTAG